MKAKNKKGIHHERNTRGQESMVGPGWRSWAEN
jgi:hypothetical protein